MLIVSGDALYAYSENKNKVSNDTQIDDPIAQGQKGPDSEKQKNNKVFVMEVDAGTELNHFELAKKFYSEHPDDYDFLAFFNDFGEVTDRIFHLRIQNTVKGIGLRMYDNSAQYGSAGKLKGVAELGSASMYLEDNHVYNALLEEVIAHHSGVYVGDIQSPEAQLPVQNPASPAHWTTCMSFPQSDKLQPYWKANFWSDNGDGTWSLVESDLSRVVKFDPFMLYLMGFLPAEKVPPALLIFSESDNQCGRGTVRTIHIQDIIERHGKREPSYAHSQKEFSTAFILLVRKGSHPTAETLEKMTRWSSKFPEIIDYATTY